MTHHDVRKAYRKAAIVMAGRGLGGHNGRDDLAKRQSRPQYVRVSLALKLRLSTRSDSCPVASAWASTIDGPAGGP